MTPQFNAQAYWIARAKRMGRTYVARGGRPREFTREFDGVAPFLRQMIGDAKSVLDFGCGVQRFREPLESGGARYAGVDHVAGFGTQPLGAELPAKTYDAAAALFVLQHIVDDELCRYWVRQLHDCLVPGGRLLLVNYDGVLAKCDPHMATRPIDFVFASAPWAKIEQVGTYDAHHWIGALTRGDVDAATTAPPYTPPAVQIRQQTGVPPRAGHGPPALILGGAACVWDDVKMLEELLGHPWDGLVIAANDVGCHWPRRLDHWCTLHPEKLGGWLADRVRRGGNADLDTWTRKTGPKGGVPGHHHHLTAWAGGATGMLAVQVAHTLGAVRAVLCGIPMTNTPHFKESTVHHSGRPWGSVNSHWRQWNTLRGRMQGWVTSMSGRTRDLLGAPSRAWLNGEPETITGVNDDHEIQRAS